VFFAGLQKELFKGSALRMRGWNNDSHISHLGRRLPGNTLGDQNDMNRSPDKRRRTNTKLIAIAFAGCLLVPFEVGGWLPIASAQIITASLSGTVQDPSGAIIPNASITLRNELSGDLRTVKSNSSGFFTFAGVSSGDYTVMVAVTGFSNLTEQGIHLDPGDSRTLTSLVLQAGATKETVTVSADNNNVPLDTGERSDLITSEQIKHLSVEGRDVTELFKTLPGFAITAQGVTNSAYDPSQVNVNGALGSYAANGNPVQGISLTLDGADITDPGNYGAAIQNVNYDQVAEVKVQVSNFGADIANGPVVVSAVTKAGGDQYHGELYTYARTYQLDSADALSKATNQPKDPDREVYPGFNVGGPVIIPGTNFNRNRKLTFFAGAEDYAQRNIYAYGGAAGALVHALVPTANMRNGNFSTSELQSYLGPQLYANSAYQNINAMPTFAKDGTPITNGQIPSSYADPGFQAIFKTYPLPNAVPTLANPYNWQSTDFINDDLWQAIGRVDVAISERNHLFGRYSVERGSSGEPSAIFYNPGELNTPGGGISAINSESAAANFTTVISPTLTNQLFGSLAYLNQAFESPDPSVLTDYPYQGAFANGRHPLLALANYNDPSGLPRSLTPDYSLGPLFSHKFDPEGGDNVTKVWGTHTVVFGVFIERVTNNQRTPNVVTNGSITEYFLPGAGQAITDVDGSTAIMSGNWVANNYEGYTSQYSQQNVLPQTNLYFWNNDFFATDSWRVRPRLTVNYGLRVEHLGLWNDAYGQGLAVFEPSLIASGAATSPYPGFVWHALDHSLPLSGNHSQPAYLAPRFGAAWDVHGTGKTVLRGGWGEYRSHDSWNDASNAVAVTQNANIVNYGGGGLSLKAVSGLNLPLASTKLPNTNTFGLSSPPGTYFGINFGDREQPLTDTYSVTLNQSLPWNTNLQIGYVGNNSRFLLNGGSNQTVALDNVNAIPIGGLYRPNPITGQVLTPTGINPTGAAVSNTSAGAGTAQVNQYRPLNTPLVQYGALDVPTHNLFSNYNGLQVGLAHQTGRIMFNINYTYSKALGIQGADGTGEPANPFNLWDDYGPQVFDRRQIFNASYTFVVGSPFQNRFAGAFANGWEVSGITTVQSGPNIPTTTSSPGFAVNGNIGQQNLPDGTPNPNYISINNTVYLGTPDVSLQPTLTCNPAAGNSGHQFINGNCFGTPNLLQNGPYKYPFLGGPAYLDSDLSAQKSFKIRESQNIQFRISAFNFLNHALTTFTGDFANEYTLNLTNPNGSAFNQGMNDPSLGFGTAAYKTGRRVVELMAKYNF
jgi:Carboxypeptidase regulatory-like domain